jgi:hypothetical protein
VRFLTQEQLVRKAAIEGLGRALRQVYTEEQVGSPPEDIARLIGQLSTGRPIDVDLSAAILAGRPSGLVPGLRRTPTQSR